MHQLSSPTARVLGCALVLIATGAALATAFSQTSPTPSQHGQHTQEVAAVDRARLHPGIVLSTDYTASIGGNPPAPVFVVDDPKGGVLALVGRSTHLGCRVAWVNRAGYERFEQDPRVAFEDPCGGALFALDGDCIGGPCARGLTRLVTTTAGSQLHIELNRSIPGRARTIDYFGN
jgi:Rieske Fe-S protein